MPKLEAKDCTLFYQLDDFTDPWTSADTVLFVHGFTENSEAWRAWVPHFARRYRVVRIDQRGFGQSGRLRKTIASRPSSTSTISRASSATLRKVRCTWSAAKAAASA